MHVTHAFIDVERENRLTKTMSTRFVNTLMPMQLDCKTSNKLYAKKYEQAPAT